MPNYARRRLVALLVLAAVGIGATAAVAFWSAGSTAGSSGASAAATVAQGSTPTAVAGSGRSVAVNWGATMVTSGVFADAYVVNRYPAAGGAAQTVNAGCRGSIAVTHCTETSVPVGSWKYTVTPRFATNWVGPESSLSGTVSVADPKLTLDTTIFGAPLPKSTTGSLADYSPNENTPYRLDASTALTGSPSSVNSSGNATITSLTIPSGTSDGAHTVHADGDAGSTA